MKPWGWAVASAVLVVVTTRSSHAVDRSKFRTCAQTGFCARHRVPLEGEHIPTSGLWHIPAFPTSIDVVNSTVLSFPLEQNAEEEDRVLPALRAEVVALANGSLRLRIVETTPDKRWETSDFLDLHTLARQCHWIRINNDDPGKALYTRDCAERRRGADWTLTIQNEPNWSLALTVNGRVAIQLNAKQLFHFETIRDRKTKTKVATTTKDDVHAGKVIKDYGEDGLAIYEDGTTQVPGAEEKVEENIDDGEWEETFGSHVDSKPNGPTSVGLDIGFPGCQHVYGIPEHASDFSLKTTRGQDARAYREPFRLYNLDVFEYELDVPMALYGSIPVMLAHSMDHTVGIFWNNPTETFVDISDVESDDGKTYKSSHWMSESGVVDVFLFTGSGPEDDPDKHISVLKQYTEVTSAPILPPIFALGYHQCRWNYKNEADVAAVNQGFEDFVIPYDVLWLDIEHTAGKRYFTWDEDFFPHPIDMQEKLSRLGRKMVTIVDPHIKRDDGYVIHQQASAKGLYVKQKDGETDFEGWCWPGSSSYVDFTSPKARTWWAEQFSLTNYRGSTRDLYTWNDMNEPSVFNGPEVSMPKDCRNIEGIEHREWHNLYGSYLQRATKEGQARRDARRRTFVLSRAFSAGSQALGAIWTGDNAASWAHLAMATKMLLSMSTVGLHFVGADVGGFFGDPDPELLLRWYQMALYQPFFRGHAHHDAKRREPAVLEAAWRTRVRTAIRWRYVLLPYVYTAFYFAHSRSEPVMRPLWWEFPQDHRTFALDTSFLLGREILVHPVTSPGQTRASVYLPHGADWFDIRSTAFGSSSDGLFHKYSGGQTLEMDVSDLDRGIPAFQRAGSIVVQKRRTRRNAALMKRDPITLQIAIDSHEGFAKGQLYLDDEESVDASPSWLMEYMFNASQIVARELAFRPSNVVTTLPQTQGTIERIVILGLTSAPARMTLEVVGEDPKTLTFVCQPQDTICTIRNPGVGILATNWRIQLTHD